MKNPLALFRLSSFCFVALLLAGVVHAQEKSGSLQGTVSDSTDAVLPGTTVTLTSQSTGRIFEAKAGPYGDYALRDVPPDSYSAMFELSGFVRMEFPAINILVGQNLRLDARMKAGAPSTTVQVTDAAPLLDSQNSSVVVHIPQDEFDRLPKARSFQQLANLASGVNPGEIEGGIQINGASGAENAYLIDGVATQSAIDGRSRQNAVFEYIQEIQVQTAGFDASTSGALGGVISAVTRSGGNTLHGNVWMYYASDALSAAPGQRLVLDPTNNFSTAFFQDSKNNSRTLEPGFSLGGPILSDRLYFYTAWSPQWSRQDQLYHFPAGFQDGTIRREQTYTSGFNKISFEPVPKVRSSFTWLWTPAKSKGSLPVFNDSCANCISSTAAANEANKVRGSFNPQSSYGFNLDFPLADNIVVSSRIGYFWDNYKDTGISDTTSVQYQTPLAGAPGSGVFPGAIAGGVGFQNTPAVFKHEHDLIARTSGQFDVRLFGRFLGTHSLKTGFGLEKTVNNVNSFFPGGYVYIWWNSSFTSPVTNVQDQGAFGYYEANDFRKLGSAGAMAKSFYAQDSWRVSSRLTLNLGVRFENEQVASFRRDIKPVAIHFGWGDKVAPRLGAAYDLFGDGRLKLYGGWGRYFDPTRYELSRNVFGAEIWRTYYRSLDTTNVFALNLGNLPGRDLWNPSVPGAFRDRRNAVAGLQSIALNLKPMSQDQWSVGADYQWDRRTSVGVHYIHQKLIRAIEDIAVLVGGNASYIYANPAEGIAVSAPFVTGTTAKPLNYPKPVRDYDAVELSVSKRLANHWFGNFSYTWSRLYGNYSGPASSDELLTTTTGLSNATAQQAGGSIAHSARNANLAWDLDEILFDSKGHLDTKGRLATDRPHVFKLNGGYEFDSQGLGRTSIGAFIYLGSGTPLSTQVYTRNHVPVFVNGRGDMGRTPFLTGTDLQVAHTIRLTEAQHLRIEMNVLNVFNQKTVLHRFTGLNRGTGVAVDSSAIDLSKTNLRNGYDYNALINATADGANAFDPRYGKADLIADGISARFGLKWSF